MNFVLRNYDQHAAKDSSCPKRPGHHRISLHPSVRVLQLVALYIWKIDRKVHHYSDVIWVWWLLKLPASRLFTQSFVQAQIKENIKAVRHWPLWGEFTGDRWIPRTKVQWRGKCFHLMTSSCIQWVTVGVGYPGLKGSGGRLNKKDGLTRYGDSHVKDKTS